MPPKAYDEEEMDRRRGLLAEISDAPAQPTTMAVLLGSVLMTAQAVPQRSTARSLPPGGEGFALVQSRCMDCHGHDLITQQRLSLDGWSREIDKMVGWGARVASTEKHVIAGYLAANFPARPEDVASLGTVDGGAELLKTRCLTCHDTRLIAQQRLSVEGWSRELDKMIGWGAAVTAAEKPILIQHLSRSALLTPR
jgi:mono/diheme cytochrome c family protein